MASLRDLLNINDAADVQSAAEPVDGKVIDYQVTCFECKNDSQADWCCISFIVPPGVTSATFSVWGGGGGAARTRCCGSGPPAGSGAFVAKTVDVNQGECYAMILGRATQCSGNNDGCAGCFTCVCSLNCTTDLDNKVRICAEGGVPGLWICDQNCGFTETCGQAVGHGGDINIPGHRGCYWTRCITDHCWDMTAVAYPGGLVNRCGGVFWLQACCRYSCGHWAQDFASLYLGGPYPGTCQGYAPGVGGAQFGTEDGNCRCGNPGNPGLVRVTYR